MQPVEGQHVEAVRPRRYERDFDVNPLIVIWEVTRACQLHCVHCRAEAQRHRHPLELTTEEGMPLIDEIAEMGHPLFVLTGGDPLERSDLFDFIRHGTARGLEVAMTPSATPRVTREALAQAREAGLARCAFSLDGATPDVHDRFRGTGGSYERTMQGLAMLRDLGIPIQVNTTVTRRNLEDLPRIADVIEPFRPVLWSVFFLVPTGRARLQDMVSADEVEAVMEWLWEQSQRRGLWMGGPAGWRTVVLFYLLGTIAFTVMGFAYKIIPFLVWTKRYSKPSGQGKPILIAELIQLDHARPVLLAFGTGVLVVPGSSAAQWTAGSVAGCVLIALALLAFCIQMLSVLNPKRLGRELFERD